jgi:hypothetical protein
MAETLRALQQKAIGRAAEDDRRWFDGNPGRQYRVRPAIPGEFNEPLSNNLPEGCAWRTIVVQMQPGVRARRRVGLPYILPCDAATDDDVRWLWEQTGNTEAQP